ncbi:hypothetical protein M8J75_016562 [Diaphorina citri]|nr:hypothetical protein M8J75_016562 [Diaphorina citri]
MHHGVLLCFFAISVVLPVQIKARPGELRVRSLSIHSPDHQSNNQSNHPKLTCDPCHYEIALITDNDEKSKSKTNPNLWESKFSKTTLDVKATNSGNFTVTVGKLNTVILSSNIDEDGKGMELSELIYYNGNLLTFDDKTGTVFHIVNDKVKPWVTLSNCNGSKADGYKSEWATVKSKKLYVGSAGFPWAPSSDETVEPKNCGPQWIKIISETGDVQNVNWKPMYNKIQNATKCKGFITHEAVMWSEIQNKWFFAPRKCSLEAFNSSTNHLIGSNILIMTDENFNKIEVVEVGPTLAGQGFSSFKFLPHSDDTLIVALKTHEDDKSFRTFITVFGINGDIYLKDTLISTEDKFEGVEILHK